MSTVLHGVSELSAGMPDHVCCFHLTHCMRPSPQLRLWSAGPPSAVYRGEAAKSWPVSLKHQATSLLETPPTPLASPALGVIWPGMFSMSWSSDGFPASSDGQMISLASGEKTGVTLRIHI